MFSCTGDLIQKLLCKNHSGYHGFFHSVAHYVIKFGALPCITCFFIVVKGRNLLVEMVIMIIHIKVMKTNDNKSKKIHLMILLLKILGIIGLFFFLMNIMLWLMRCVHFDLLDLDWWSTVKVSLDLNITGCWGFGFCDKTYHKFIRRTVN